MLVPRNIHFCFMSLLIFPVALQVSVSLSANESMPGDTVTLRVQGEKDSCVCVATVDKSMYLLKPDFQLSPDKVSPQFKVIFNSLSNC